MAPSKKEKLEEISTHIQETQIDPINQRLRGVETRTEETKMRKWFEEQFNERMATDTFRNRITTLFNEFLKGEHFLNKVDNRAEKVVKAHNIKRTNLVLLWAFTNLIAVVLGGVVTGMILKALGAG